MCTYTHQEVYISLKEEAKGWAEECSQMLQIQEYVFKEMVERAWQS